MTTSPVVLWQDVQANDSAICWPRSDGSSAAPPSASPPSIAPPEAKAKARTKVTTTAARTNPTRPSPRGSFVTSDFIPAWPLHYIYIGTRL